MRKPAGVIAAAVVLALMTVLGLLGSVMSLAITLLATREPELPGVRLMMVLITAVMVPFFLLCGWTVVGLFRVQRWARYSTLAIGGLEFCITAFMGLVMILMRNAVPPPPGTGPAVSMSLLMAGMGAFYLCLSLIGLWWLVYFNLAHVRAAFQSAGFAPGEVAAASGEAHIGAAAAAGGGWRIVIVVWACLALFGSLFFPVLLAMHLPVFLFGAVVRGPAATAVVVLMFLVQLFLGIGLLMKWRAAWYVALACQAYTLAYFLALFAPGMLERFAAYQQEVTGRWGVTATSPYSTRMLIANLHAIAGLSIAIAVALVILLTIALVRRRGDYLQTG
jgi:hypothetical protein